MAEEGTKESVVSDTETTNVVQAAETENGVQEIAEEPIVFKSKKEFNSFLDKERNKSKFDAEKKLKTESLKEQQKWEELAKVKEAEVAALQHEKEMLALSNTTSQEFSKLGLSDLAKIYEFDSQTAEGRLSQAKYIKDLITKGIEDGVKSKLSTKTMPTSSAAKSVQRSWVGKPAEEWTKEDLDNFNASRTAG